MTGRIVTPEEAQAMAAEAALADRARNPDQDDQDIQDLAFTVEQQGHQIAAVKVLHAPTKIQVISEPCASEECNHEQECPTVSIQVCIECLEVVEVGNPYGLEYPNATDRVLYPCPTARALGVES